jgi:hypothetical protein
MVKTITTLSGSTYLVDTTRKQFTRANDRVTVRSSRNDGTSPIDYTNWTDYDEIISLSPQLVIKKSDGRTLSTSLVCEISDN